MTRSSTSWTRRLGGSARPRRRAHPRAPPGVGGRRGRGRGSRAPAQRWPPPPPRSSPPWPAARASPRSAARGGHGLGGHRAPFFKHADGRRRDRADGRGRRLRRLLGSRKTTRRSTRRSGNEEKNMKTSHEGIWPSSSLVVVARPGGGAEPHRHGHRHGQGRAGRRAPRRRRHAHRQDRHQDHDDGGQRHLPLRRPRSRHLLGPDRARRLQRRGGRTTSSVTVGKEAVVDFALKVGGMSETLDVVGEAPVVDTTSSATNNAALAGPALQHAHPPGQHRDQPPELRPRHQRQRRLRRRRRLRQRPPHRRRGHPRSFGRHGLDLLQLQHRGGGAVHRHRRSRGVRRLHRAPS